MNGLRLDVLPGRYAVARLDGTEELPGWADGPGFTSVSRSGEELSVVCDESRVPDHVHAERGFRCLRVAGPLNFAQTGILASIAGPLADAGISIFAVSTFDTDYLLLRGDDLAAAVAVLAAADHQIVET